MSHDDYRRKYNVKPGDSDYYLPSMAGFSYCCGFKAVDCASLANKIADPKMTEERFRDYLKAIVGSQAGAIVTDTKKGGVVHKLLNKVIGDPDLLGKNYGWSGNNIYIWLLGKNRLNEEPKPKADEKPIKTTISVKKPVKTRKKLPTANKKSAPKSRTSKRAARSVSF